MLDSLLRETVDMLAGDWADRRDCHVRPDLVLIYRKPDEATPELVCIGSRSELEL